MKETKTEALSLRVTKRFKAALRIASERERRSQANLLEVLLFDYCATHGIELGGDVTEASLENVIAAKA